MKLGVDGEQGLAEALRLWFGAFSEGDYTTAQAFEKASHSIKARRPTGNGFLCFSAIMSPWRFLSEQSLDLLHQLGIYGNNEYPSFGTTL
jgi:hypothetical protein